MSQKSSSLAVEAVTMRYGSHVAVDNVTLTVGKGEFLGLLGPSGCGKTTLLRMVAGFLMPAKGQILCDDVNVTRKPAYARRFGMVFQNYALFPHMTAAENVAYGLKIAGVGRSERETRVREVLDRVGLNNAGGQYPAQLSGGMQQRVALARALVIEPAVLLLDEPLSALDKNLREEMQVELRLLQQNVGVTTIFVTHDQEEAMTLSDRIAVMKDGKLLQLGPPEKVYMAPETQFVATFLGTTNLLLGKIRTQKGEPQVEIDGNLLPVSGAAGLPPEGSQVTIAIRPENLVISDAQAGLTGRIKEVLFQGHRQIVIFETDQGQELRAYAPSSQGFARGQTAQVSWNANTATILQE